MSSRGLIAGLTVGLLVATAPAALSGAAAADADGTVIDSVALPGRPIASEMVPMAVSGDGSTLVTVTTAGLTKHRVTSRSITRLGRNTSKSIASTTDVEVRPDGRFAYLMRNSYQGARFPRLDVFDLRGKRPRLVRTLTFRALSRVLDTEITPDGRRLFLATRETIQVLRLGNHPARPRKGPAVHEPEGTGELTIVPDGTRMVTAPQARTQGTGNVLRVWDITHPGGPVVEREGLVTLSGGENWQTWINELAMSPSGDAIYVETGYSIDEFDGSYHTEITRLRFSDLATEARTPVGPDGPDAFLAAVGRAGSRVFVRTGYTTDEPEVLRRGLAWLNPELTSSQRVAGVGNVRGVAASSEGRSSGTVFVAGRKDGKLRIYANRF